MLSPTPPARAKTPRPQSGVSCSARAAVPRRPASSGPGGRKAAEAELAFDGRAILQGRFQSEKKPADWLREVRANLTSAARVTAAADDRILQNTQTDIQAAETDAQQQSRVFQLFQVKLANTRLLLDTLCQRLQRLKAVLKQTKQSREETLKALKAKGKPLQFCKYRLQLRAGRPGRELVHDKFQEALEAECHDLESAKNALLANGHQTSSMVQLISDCIKKLEDDVAKKQASARIDKQCLRSHKQCSGAIPGQILSSADDTRSYASSSATRRSRASSASRAGRGSSGVSASAMRNEKHRVQETLHLVKVIEEDLEQRAVDLCNANAKAIATWDAKCHRAFERTQARMRERIAHVEDSRQKLQQQLATVTAKLDQTRMSMRITDSNLEHHQLPLEVAENQQKLRALRPQRELIRDEVAAGLEHQLQRLQASMYQLESEKQRTQVVLQELERTKSNLETDLKDKTLALQIDMQCERCAALVTDQ